MFLNILRFFILRWVNKGEVDCKIYMLVVGRGNDLVY